jgi:hypothetical protein
VNKVRNPRRLTPSQFAPTAYKRLFFVDERQQILNRWVQVAPAPPAEAGLGRFVGLGESLYHAALPPGSTVFGTLDTTRGGRSSLVVILHKQD